MFSAFQFPYFSFYPTVHPIPSRNFFPPPSAPATGSCNGLHIKSKSRKQSAVWTVSGMIVWGGLCNTTVFNDTFSYNPGQVMFLYQKP